MAISSGFPLPNNITAARLTHGVKGAKAMEQVADHLATTAGDTVESTGHSLNTQMAGDLRKVMLAVGSSESEAGVQGHARMSSQSAMMAAGALLGMGGVVVSDMAGKLHGIASDRKSLQQFAEQVREVPQGQNEEIFNSLATKVTQRAGSPVAMFMSGAFLGAEQKNGTLMESARNNTPIPDFDLNGPNGGYLLSS